ncbi:MAG: RNA polymerase sigma-70 factor [Egibacteraceae bacterium]
MATGSVEEFEAQRRRLFGLAYRLLGSAEEAEDVVQDAFLRWDGTDRAAIATPAAWLAKVVTNLSLNRLTSARARRERYVGPWLPEPVLTADGALGPLETAEQRDSVSFALLVLLEQLTPAERAVYVLREAFDYRHREIAGVLELSETNTRQLHRRAARRLAEARPRLRPQTHQLQGLVERFLAAAGDGDLSGLEELLADEVTSWSDGGGKVTAARRPVVGREAVARLYAGLLAKAAAMVEVSVVEVNGEPAVLAWSGENLLAVLVLELDRDRIGGLRVVVNPDKLSFVTRQAASLSHPRRLSGPSR